MQEGTGRCVYVSDRQGRTKGTLLFQLQLTVLYCKVEIDTYNSFFIDYSPHHSNVAEGANHFWLLGSSQEDGLESQRYQPQRKVINTFKWDKKEMTHISLVPAKNSVFLFMIAVLDAVVLYAMSRRLLCGRWILF